ncbi:proton extrusion protein PcxA [Anabaena sp. FACHB-1237]|uniref:proton extrusion protein PcxA n=1 Tax=Anabaena sp. FACHB-1237 TaxID=2692769 RepID=UPI0016810428|nr:proton extrusion protein PcxA [Anabaena sp. FACHB-1237]MBD2136204.1 proton extrusion protein PcxA [Anabaena sp. FACHB-1237]
MLKNTFFSQKIYPFLLSAYRWYLLTPERALIEAYQAAIKIKEIEDQHFNGNKIDSQSTNYSPSVLEYFQGDLRTLLKTIEMRLTEFKASRWFANESKQKAAIKANITYSSAEIILEKLQFIDEITAKYTNKYIGQNEQNVNSQVVIIPKDFIENTQTTRKKTITNSPNKPKGKADSTGILPRSILSTISRLQVELDPESEEDVVKNFRQSQKRSVLAVRFILLLIIVPLLTHQLSKLVIVGPLVDHFRKPAADQIFLHEEMEEEALMELQRFEEKIKFQNLIIDAPPLEEKDIEHQLVEKAEELAEKFKWESANAVKNVFADMFAVSAFTWLLLVSKSSIAVLKEFFDHVVYGLSDSAKAFIIILFTDIFVGFHSPHGWEVILEGISRHLGLPANRDFIFLFIATFPVILDTIFKYWIFRYLNRISPSAVATYHNMNE